MLDYTKLALQKTYEDFKKIGHVFSVVTQLLYIAYLTYSVIAQAGRWWIKVAFLTVSVVYFIFYMVIHYHPNKKLGKAGKKIFKRSKLLIKLFELVVAFYSISVTTNDTTTVSVILLAMMLVGWLLQVVFDLIVSVLEKRIQLFMEAIKADIAEIKRPIDTVSNFFKKMTGKAIEEEPEKSKQRVWLDKHVDESRQEKREQKRQARETRKAEKQALRDQRQAERRTRSKRHAVTSKTDPAMEEAMHAHPDYSDQPQRKRRRRKQ